MYKTSTEAPRNTNMNSIRSSIVTVTHRATLNPTAPCGAAETNEQLETALAMGRVSGAVCWALRPRGRFDPSLPKLVRVGVAGFLPAPLAPDGQQGAELWSLGWLRARAQPTGEPRGAAMEGRRVIRAPCPGVCDVYVWRVSAVATRGQG